MSLSKIFSASVLALTASFAGQARNAYADTRAVESHAIRQEISEAEEVAFTQKLGRKFPVIERLISFRDVAGVPWLNKAINDLGIRRLAYAMTPTYRERCGDPMKRKDICHVNNDELFGALTYSQHFIFDDKSLRRLSAKLNYKYSAERSYLPYRANCYSYAVGDYFMNRMGGAGVGEATYGLQRPQFHNAQDVIQTAIADGLEYAGVDPQAINIPQGKRLILLYVHMENGEFEDYHWTRVDRKKDGTLEVGQKMGPTKMSLHHQLKNIYEEMRRTFTNSGEGYKFSGFFYVLTEGLDVGYDAYGRRHGILPALNRKLDEIPTLHEMTVSDFNTLKVININEQSPR